MTTVIAPFPPTDGTQPCMADPEMFFPINRQALRAPGTRRRTSQEPGMSPLDQMRALFTTAGRKRGERRFQLYGLFDAYTGELVRAFHTRDAAMSAKTASSDPHRMRVRGVPPGMKIPKRKRPKKLKGVR